MKFERFALRSYVIISYSRGCPSAVYAHDLPFVISQPYRFPRIGFTAYTIPSNELGDSSKTPCIFMSSTKSNNYIDDRGYYSSFIFSRLSQFHESAASRYFSRLSSDQFDDNMSFARVFSSDKLFNINFYCLIFSKTLNEVLSECSMTTQRSWRLLFPWTIRWFDFSMIKIGSLQMNYGPIIRFGRCFPNEKLDINNDVMLRVKKTVHVAAINFFDSPKRSWTDNEKF